jgi:y4mF family transcriptional regulator
MSNMIKTAKDLGALIRQRRKEMGLSQADLAGICNVGNRFLVELEAGKPTIQFDKALHVAANVGLELRVRKKGDEIS